MFGHSLSQKISAFSLTAIVLVNICGAQSKMDDKQTSADFYSVLKQVLRDQHSKMRTVLAGGDDVSRRILQEYGAVFLAVDGVEIPPVSTFDSEEDVTKFQAQLLTETVEIEGTSITLQRLAMHSYLEARDEAEMQGLSITPRGGSEAARRSFADTTRLWKSRVEPACEYWVTQGKLSVAEAGLLLSLPAHQQVQRVLDLEKHEVFFNTWFNNSILYSVAAPGSSQHLSMLALDVEEFDQQPVRELMARHGWYRTVRNDLPHFTFLGRNESDLSHLGLKHLETADGEFWVPNVGSEQ
jgi:hypothetical protein